MVSTQVLALRKGLPSQVQALRMGALGKCSNTLQNGTAWKGVDMDRQTWLQLSALLAQRGQKQGMAQNFLELGLSHLQKNNTCLSE